MLYKMHKTLKTRPSISWCRLALNVQIYLQMNRADHAEKQLRVMQQLDEDHTLTQLANAWVDLVMVGTHISHGSQFSHAFQSFSSAAFTF
jgi:hypothetical protein